MNAGALQDLDVQGDITALCLPVLQTLWDIALLMVKNREKKKIKVLINY